MIHNLGIKVNLPENWEVSYEGNETFIKVGDYFRELTIADTITENELHFVLDSIDRCVEKRAKKRYAISFIKSGYLLEDIEYSAHGFGKAVHRGILIKMTGEKVIDENARYFSEGDLDLFLETFNIKDCYELAHECYGYFREFIKDYEPMELSEVLELVNDYNEFLIEFPIFQS